MPALANITELTISNVISRDGPKTPELTLADELKVFQKQTWQPRITRWCHSRGRSSSISSTFVPWTLALTSLTIIAAVTAPGEVAGAVDFSELFLPTDGPRE